MRDSDPFDYNQLNAAYYHASLLCDPLDFANRQKDLLHAIAKYLLERDEPKEQKKIRKKNKADTAKAFGKLK